MNGIEYKRADVMGETIFLLIIFEFVIIGISVLLAIIYDGFALIFFVTVTCLNLVWFRHLSNIVDQYTIFTKDLTKEK